MTNTAKPNVSGQLTLPGMSKAELDRLEGKIRAGLKSFVEVGRALQEIRDKRGFLLREYKTFETYCEGEFHFSLRQGERLMLAAETADKVKEVTGEVPPNEAVARVLTTVARDDKALHKVVDHLKKRGQSIATATAERVQEVVDRVTKPRERDDGHESAPAPSAAERAAAPILKSLSDACPSCHEVPDNYLHVETGWQCGHCGAPVRISALPSQIAACRECGAPLVGGAGYCMKCGSVQA